MDVAGFGSDDEESADAASVEVRAATATTTTRRAGELDLTPRQAAPAKKRQWWAFGVLAVIICAVGFVAVKALGDATLFFYNADEAVAKREELGTDRFKLQGTPVSGTITQNEGTVDFTIQFNGVEVAVSHVGDPPELFEAGTPVVVVGHWNEAGTTFESDEMMIKHDASYEEDNGDRLKEAQEGGQVPAGQTSPDVSP